MVEEYCCGAGECDFIGFGDAWISTAFVLVLAIGALQGAYFTKTDRKLAAMVESELASGATTLSPEYQAEAQREGSMGALTGLLVLATVAVMVFKPGA